jgi:hypothetical protein
VAQAAPTATTPRPSVHPLIWTALVVWLSIEAIGDGLLAVRTVLSSRTASRSVTPS